MRVRMWSVVAAAAMAFAMGCDDGEEGGAGGSGGAGAGGEGGTPPILDMMMGEGGEGGAGAQGGAGGAPEMDMRVIDMAPPAMDMAPPEMDMAVVDMGPRPDVGPLDGDPCDPRLRSTACAPGKFCQHIPGQPEQFGACQEGDGCLIGGDDCPAETPYCHLRGAATVCTAAGELAEGEDCVDDPLQPRPCAEGLVCNFSVCQKPCTPGGDLAQCPNDGRCADISERTGVPGSGLCAPRGCDWFTGTGCNAGQKCNYAIRGDGAIVGSCFPEHGQNQLGSQCGLDELGGDNCAQGLICIGPPDGERVCRVMCDIGHYEAPCPERYTCREALQTQNGQVRGYGFCFINQ